MNFTDTEREFISQRVCFYSSMYKGRSCMREIIECGARFGVAGIEMMNFCQELKSPDMAEAKALAALARSYGMTLPCFSVGINLVCNEREENFNKLLGYLNICSELEIPYLHHTIFSGLFKSAMEGWDPEEVYKQGLDIALRVNEIAAAKGVQTLVEDQGMVFNGAKGFDRLMRDSGGRIGFLLDVGNIFFAGDTAEKLLQTTSAPVCHMHVKDYRYLSTPEKGSYTDPQGRYFADCEIGTGDICYPAIRAELDKRGYNGYVAMEYSGVKDEDEVSRTLAFVANALG